MRGRMLRAEIDGEVAEVVLGHRICQLFAASLLIARQRIVRAFPWREEIEVAKFLVETDGFVKHPLLLIVVAHLDEAGKREILAQRVALKTVVGQQPPHVRMTDEDHPIKIVGLALEPVGPWKHLDDRRHLGSLIGFRAQADAGVQRRRQQVIDHVEALLALGIVHRGHIDEADEAAIGIVAQETHDVDDLVGVHRHRELIERNVMIDRGARQRANNRLTQGVEPAVVHSKNLSVRWFRCAGSSSAAASRRKAALPRSAGSRARRYRWARCGRSRAPPNTNNDSSRRHWRTTPSRSRSAAPASGRRPCAAPAPSCWSGYPQQSSRRTAAAKPAARNRRARRHNAASTSASSRPRNMPGRTSSTSTIRYAPR